MFCKIYLQHRKVPLFSGYSEGIFNMVKIHTKSRAYTSISTSRNNRAKPKLDLNAVKAKVGSNTLTELRELTCIYLEARGLMGERVTNRTKDPITGKKPLKTASGSTERR